MSFPLSKATTAVTRLTLSINVSAKYTFGQSAKNVLKADYEMFLQLLIT
jgi:hypothetical protein